MYTQTMLTSGTCEWCVMGVGSLANLFIPTIHSQQNYQQTNKIHEGIFGLFLQCLTKSVTKNLRQVYER